ncbi:uncharacterized protein PV09_03587 [Verruconis gallopava]|uniref:Coenzyme Q-binding protein COQ10 START domain-containing protein n=1 Tax=Verruconis gallopava TaxID=253628 RepID=A0A0D2AGL7_9PEZI|nr:uncharacterized protein PV09_03587 [Verruconis gallopava]KIW05730.1 hypothetical protein PV09_03587 [Verruconis gallopava]
MATESHPANRTIDTSILINAPIAKVRSILFDFKSYPSWSKFIQKIEPLSDAADAPLAVGQQLAVTMGEPGGKPTTMTMTVSLAEENGFAWEGKLGAFMIFGGKHMFLLSDEGNGQTKLRHREEFFGVLYAPLFVWSGLEAKSKVNYQTFNESVKAKAEQEEAKL